MLDIKLIRENSEAVRNNLMKRGDPEIIRILDELIDYDQKWRQLLFDLNELRHERKLITARIAALKKEKKSVEEELGKAKAVDLNIENLEQQVTNYEEKVRYCLMRLPNLLHESVPVGDDEKGNVTVRVWGEKPKFSFPVRDHIDIALKLDIMDVERAGKIAGARFFYLKNEGVLLDMALMNFALEELVKKGYKPIEPPFMMRRKPYEGVISLRDFEDVLYKIENEDLYIIATSEHPIAAMYMGEVLKAEDLPLKFAGVSTNFRKEAGAHGRDTRGIFRTHQFNKVEQFVFCKPED
ncbi:MAG: serine--tRNA ligase, partial [Candidatus Bathyarchaeia archaeon]